MENYDEYVTFTITSKEGKEIEMAVVDEFEFKRKNYVVSSVVEGDEIRSDEIYIYKANIKEDDFTVEKITDMKEYEEVSKAYLEMAEKEADAEE